MTQCPYVYCRAIRTDETSSCPRCGHPADEASLRTPEFFLGAMAALPDLGGPLLDMHQILPVHPKILMYQRLAMEQLGIERALLQSSPDEATSLQGNAELAAVAAEHPSQFWASQFVDPMASDALAALDAIHAAGHHVVKLLPVTGWRANDPTLRPFWERMQALALVAMVHTGFFTGRHKDEEAAAGRFMDSRLADPLFFDEPCRRFPDLVVILCHMGGAVFYEQAAQMVTQHDNVWGDVSGTGLFALRRITALDVAVDYRKLLWGNDSPPFAYPLNLALFLHATESQPHIRRPLLYDNGSRFAAAHLGA